MTGRIVTEPAERYHAAKALSAGVIHTLTERCPAAAWWESPWNEYREDKPKTIFDIGAATHLLALEPADYLARVKVIGAPDYRTKAAREVRDEAREAGKIPLLLDDHTRIAVMRSALAEHPVSGAAFSQPGEVEHSVYWADPETGIACKCRPDKVLPRTGRSYAIDLKTTANAEPNALRAHAWRMGWHQRAAWYADGLAATSDDLGRVEYWFVAIERDPPHLVSVLKLSDDALFWGRKQNRKAVETWARCLERNEWPGYREPEQPDEDRAFEIGLPPWAQRELEARDARGAFAPRGFATTDMETAAAMQAPLGGEGP